MLSYLATDVILTFLSLTFHLWLTSNPQAPVFNTHEQTPVNSTLCYTPKLGLQSHIDDQDDIVLPSTSTQAVDTTKIADISLTYTDDAVDILIQPLSSKSQFPPEDTSGDSNDTQESNSESDNKKTNENEEYFCINKGMRCCNEVVKVGCSICPDIFLCSKCYLANYHKDHLRYIRIINRWHKPICACGWIRWMTIMICIKDSTQYYVTNKLLWINSISGFPDFGKLFLFLFFSIYIY